MAASLSTHSQRLTRKSHMVILPSSCPEMMVSSRGPHKIEVTLGPSTGIFNVGVEFSVNNTQKKNCFQNVFYWIVNAPIFRVK